MPPLSPTVVIFLCLGTAYALLFHVWKGKHLAHLPLFWLVSVVGFGIGYVVSGMWPTHPVVLGSIPVVEASVGSLVMLLVARRFSV